MGYYTEYSLTVRNIRDEAQYEDLKETMKTKELIGYAFDEGDYSDKHREAMFSPCDEVKWYDHAKDMAMIAEQYPNMYFMLEGKGEEFGDFWREFYHNVDIEECRGEIVYEQPKKVQWAN